MTPWGPWPEEWPLILLGWAVCTAGWMVRDVARLSRVRRAGSSDLGRTGA